jgi:hypothetical protein
MMHGLTDQLKETDNYFGLHMASLFDTIKWPTGGISTILLCWGHPNEWGLPALPTCVNEPLESLRRKGPANQDSTNVQNIQQQQRFPFIPIVVVGGPSELHRAPETNK